MFASFRHVFEIEYLYQSYTIGVNNEKDYTKRRTSIS